MEAGSVCSCPSTPCYDCQQTREKGRAGRRRGETGHRARSVDTLPSSVQGDIENGGLIG